MRLRCVAHGKRVQVIDVGTAKVSVPLTVHASNSKTNELCDSNTLIIGGEFFTPERVLDFRNDEENTDDYLARKADELIYY